MTHSLSSHFCESLNCLNELRHAYQRQVNQQIKIIPVLLDDRQTILNSLSDSDKGEVEAILDSTLWIPYNHYDSEKTGKELVRMLGRYQGICFEPVRYQNTQGDSLQFLELQITSENGFLPSNLLETWQFNPVPFLATNEKQNKEKPIHYCNPVVIVGKLPNWVIAHLAIPFHNNRTVYLYNNQTRNYICVYALNGDQKHHVGKVLKQTE